jgi:hypothetical protein
MRQTTTALLAALQLAALALGACAGDGGQAPPEATTAAPPSSRAGPPRVPAGVVVTGVVRDGVEPGCRLLVADRGPTYLLLGGDRRALRPGARVRVSGTLAAGTVSVCQQGRPLRVVAVRPG